MKTFSLRDRFNYEFIWSARMMRGKEEIYASKEKKLERKILAKKGLSIPEVQRVPLDEINIKDFDFEWFTKHHMCQRPLVIREAVKDSQMVKKWSLNYLKEKVGHVEVPVHEKAEKGDTLYDKGILECRLDEFIDDVIARKGAKYMVGSSTLMAYGERELLDDIPVDEIGNLFNIDVIRAEMFVGNEKNWSPWHSAGPETFFFQAYGQKEWKFVDPTFTACMYPAYGFINGPAAVQTKIDTSRLEDFPLYGIPTIYTTTLNPGDMLYNAPHWWHEVSNVGESIGISLRVMPRKPLKSPFLFVNSVQIMKAMTDKTWRKVLFDMFKNKLNKKSLKEMEMDDEPVKMSYKKKKGD